MASTTKRIKPTPTQIRLYTLLQLGGQISTMNAPKGITVATARALAAAGLAHVEFRQEGGRTVWRARRVVADVAPAQRGDGYFMGGDAITFTNYSDGIHGVVQRVVEIEPVNGPGGLAVEWRSVKTGHICTHEITDARLKHAW